MSCEWASRYDNTITNREREGIVIDALLHHDPFLRDHVGLPVAPTEHMANMRDVHKVHPRELAELDEDVTGVERLRALDQDARLAIARNDAPNDLRNEHQRIRQLFNLAGSVVFLATPAGGYDEQFRLGHGSGGSH